MQLLHASVLLFFSLILIKFILIKFLVKRYFHVQKGFVLLGGVGFLFRGLEEG